ncbi:ANK_REP_REGION domain-containing protein [Trichonephila inaurata madagascariensis]|uniref:Alpha-latrotoxin n=1 Tax=Trichonephila inaurata madagascariensis TaxID=2747483 RepID=A0A8X6Y2X6_9ARAC|nr:ANK_REP_REGION domain-containing protein [Trichonephila inaurata madagascariensis]GFY79886.1 ANK_REP_REGION domain-containing protein [Trichonephila inaurata madagascariensis]
MKYEQFSAIYNTLKSASADSSLDQGNVIKTIKDQLLPDSDGYKEWEKGNFSLDHVFTTVNDYGAESKHTLLTCACKLADLKVVDLLLKVEANVNAVGEDGLTPLIIAIEKKFDNPTNKALVDLLIKEADVNAAGADGMTPISKAVERGDLETFEALKKKGANVNIQVCGMSLLKWAEDHKSINRENMEKIIDVLKASSEEKKQTDPESTTEVKEPVGATATSASSSNTSTEPIADNKTPKKNDTTFWSEHKGKIALSIVGLCVAGAVAAYMLAYLAVALALAVLAAVILIGAGIDKFCEKSESPNTKSSDPVVSECCNNTKTV